MTTVKRFEDLAIWSSARSLCLMVFKLTSKEYFSRDFSLKDQIRRSSGSVMDNISEGFGRDGNKEFVHFLSIAKASLNEVKSQLYRATDYEYISSEEFDETYKKCDSVAAGISKLMYYLINSNLKGSKFK
jgi:four helix bundle protein